MKKRTSLNNERANDPSIFKIDANRTLIGIKKTGWDLKHFEIPEGVRCVTLNAFDKIHNLESLTLPSSLREFHLPCSIFITLKNIINHSSVLFEWWIEHHKYNGKTLNTMPKINLNEYFNSDGKPFTIIEEYAFVNCKSLSYIEIDENIQSIGCNIFLSCDLKSENVISRSSVLFDWWIKNHKYNDKTLSEMKKIDLNEYTNSIGKPFTKINSFSFCDTSYYSDGQPLCIRLQSFNTGPFITKIEKHAFLNCKFLRHVDIGENVQSIDGFIFFGCDELKSKNVISHSPALFRWWVDNHKYNGKPLNRIETIDLDKYTNSDNKPFAIISENAFHSCCNLKNILFGNTIKWIDKEIFGKHENLKNIQISNKNIKFHSNAFNYLPKTTKFYVLDKEIKEKLQAIGISSERIFIKPIPTEELTTFRKSFITRLSHCFRRIMLFLN